MPDQRSNESEFEAQESSASVPLTVQHSPAPLALLVPGGWRIEGLPRPVRQASLGVAANCHTFRATGITAYLLNGGTVENAQAIAAHESPRTTKLFDRTAKEISLDEIERIVI